MLGVFLKQQKPLKSGAFVCDRDRIRTCDRLLRRQMLYPAELRDLITHKNCCPKLNGANLVIFSYNASVNWIFFKINFWLFFNVLCYR